MLALIAALPWLVGFEPSAQTEHGSGYAEVELVTGDQRIVASFERGIVVFDHDQPKLQAPGFTRQGSADEILAVATGDAWIGTPVLALAATSGGHNENTTWLTLYRLDTLAPVWSGEVERHEDHVTRTGVVVLFPGGLVYRSPDGAMQTYRFDKDQNRYINRGSFGPEV
jgi:hypothetical protein